MFQPEFDSMARAILIGTCNAYAKQWTPAAELSNEPILPPLIAQAEIVGGEVRLYQPLDPWLAQLGLTNELARRGLMLSLNEVLQKEPNSAFFIAVELFNVISDVSDINDISERFHAGGDLSKEPGATTAIAVHVLVPAGKRMYVQRMADNLPDGDVRVMGLDTETVLVPRSKC